MKNALEDLFMTLHQRLLAALRAEAEKAGFTISQLEVLRFIVAQKHPTMKDIAEHLHITAPSATALVDHLYARKLVTRKTDPKDRRGVRISPTPKTTKLFSTFKGIKANVVSELFSPLGTADRTELIKIIKKLL